MADRLDNGMTPSENARIAASVVTEDDLVELEALHADMHVRIDKARENGLIYLMGQYVRMAALIQPEIKRIRDRFHRETLASVRKEHKALKLEAKAASQNGATA